MSGQTRIEWADKVWNPVVGCTPVSAGCAHCYAERIYERFSKGLPFSQVQLHPERLEDPWHWKKPSRIFVNSMSDLFHEDVPDEFICQVFTIVLSAPRHQFMVLTKRPQRMKEFFERRPGAVWVGLPNLWLGVTAENQKAADERIPLLLGTPAAVRFVSVEPMLGPVDLLGNHERDVWPWIDARSEGHGVDWVICGGETGPGARPMHPDWVRSLRDQCTTAQVPFFLKSWGEWAAWPKPISQWSKKIHLFPDGFCYYRVGKKAAGREIDGREWNEFPEVGR